MIAFSVKFFALVVWPLAVMLPVAITQSFNDAAVAACIFFMLLPHVLYLMLWMVARFTGIIADLDAIVSVQEVMVVGSLMGVLLPVTVLTPLLVRLALPTQPQNVLLACTLTLVGLALPLIAATLWAPALVDERLARQKSIDREATGRRELLLCFFALFLFFSVPLCGLLPIFLRAPVVSEASEAALVFFMLASATTSFFALVGPRLGVLVHNALMLGPDSVAVEIALKLLGGLVILPVVVLLPVFLTTKMRPEPRAMMLAFIISLPSLTILDCLRLRFSSDRPKLACLVAVWFFGVIVPVGILLPAWLASSPGASGSLVLACFMFGPPVLVLLGVLWFTAKCDALTPFDPRSLVSAGSVWIDSTYVVVCTCLPLTILLPLYYFGHLAPDTARAVVSFAGILAGLVAIIFIVSFARRREGRAVGHAKTGGTLPLTRPANNAAAFEDALPRRSSVATGLMFSPRELGLLHELQRASGSSFPGFDGEDRRPNPDTLMLTSSPRENGSQNGDAVESSTQSTAVPSTAHRRPRSAALLGGVGALPGLPNFSKGESRATRKAVPFPTGSLRGNGANYAARLASSLYTLHNNALIPPRTDHGAVNTWETVSLWNLDFESGELVCATQLADLKIFDPTTPYAQGNRHAVYVAQMRESAGDFVLKWDLAPPVGHTRAAVTHLLQASLLTTSCAAEFNKCMALMRPDGLSVTVVQPQAVCLEARHSTSGDPVWALLESDISRVGALFKFNSNDGFVASTADVDVDDASRWSEAQWADYLDLAQAFSCFSYNSSNFEYVFTSIRGIGAQYVQPDVHWAGGYDPFEDARNLADEGIEAFVDTHLHNQFCEPMVRMFEQQARLDADALLLSRGEPITGGGDQDAAR